ncbi:hypothetical protein RUND412_006911 [Rhizina undulata]
MRSKDEGKALILIAASSLLLGAATVAVATRLYTRKKLARESFQADDWLIAAATHFPGFCGVYFTGEDNLACLGDVPTKAGNGFVVDVDIWTSWAP